MQVIHRVVLYVILFVIPGQKRRLPRLQIRQVRHQIPRVQLHLRVHQCQPHLRGRQHTSAPVHSPHIRGGAGECRLREQSGGREDRHQHVGRAADPQPHHQSATSRHRRPNHQFGAGECRLLQGHLGEQIQPGVHQERRVPHQSDEEDARGHDVRGGGLQSR